jgi:hypothetical protein
MTAPTGYSPGRPPNERDVVQTINGQPNFLGVLTSTAAAPVNNATTAVPFNVKSSIASRGFQGSLAGKTLLLQATANGLILPGEDNTVSIVQQATAPNPPAAVPGILITAAERVELTLGPTTPCLQFATVSGTGSLLVWEMT